MGLEKYEFMELVELFIETARSDLEKLTVAVDSKMIRDAGDAAHSLKGAAGNLGLSGFYEAARKVEMEIHDGRLERIPESVETLKVNLEEIAGDLNRNKTL